MGITGLARVATHFLLLRQKKVSKEKATLLCASLRYASGNLRCSLFAGSAQTRLRLKQRAALIREKLRSSAHTEGLGAGRSGLCFARPGLWERRYRCECELGWG